MRVSPFVIVLSIYARKLMNEFLRKHDAANATERRVVFETVVPAMPPSLERDRIETYCAIDYPYVYRLPPYVPSPPIVVTRPSCTKLEPAKRKEVRMVRKDPSQPCCAVSGEPFETVWSDDLECWAYKDAVRLDPNGPIVHKSWTSSS